MAMDALTEPLLPRGRDDDSSTTATGPAQRRAIDVPAAATAERPDRVAALGNDSAPASATSTAAPAPASASTPTKPREDRPAAYLPPVVAVVVHREDAAPNGTFAVDHASAPTTAAPASASPPTTTSPPATTTSPGRRANPTPDPDAARRNAVLRRASASASASASPPARSSSSGRRVPDLASGAEDPALPSSSGNAVIYTSLCDELSGTGSPTDSEPATPISASQVNQNSPRVRRSTVTEVNMDGDSDEVESISQSRVANNRGSFRTPRGTKLRRRLGLMRPRKDTSWDKESFMYTCVLVLLIGLVAYLSSLLDGWSPYLRITFILIFGAATGLACIGAMALISETPHACAPHFAHIVSRLTFIVGSLAFEAAVFYLLGEIGFIVWLFVAAVTVSVMTHIWKVGSPKSFGTLVGLFRRS